MKVGVILIATRKYTRFVTPLLESLAQNFLADEDVTVHLFTDDVLACHQPDRRAVNYYSIPSHGFPDATLLRYETIDAHWQDFEDEDYLFYLDVDMEVVRPIFAKDICGEGLTAVLHAGYWPPSSKGAWEEDQRSFAYVHPDRRRHYVAGGFQGGTSRSYLAAVQQLKERIEVDRTNGIVATWHDESHWNWLVNRVANVLLLAPTYCFPPFASSVASWGLEGMNPYIVALAKDHEEMRS